MPRIRAKNIIITRITALSLALAAFIFLFIAVYRCLTSHLPKRKPLTKSISKWCIISNDIYWYGICHMPNSCQINANKDYQINSVQCIIIVHWPDYIALSILRIMAIRFQSNYSIRIYIQFSNLIWCYKSKAFRIPNFEFSFIVMIISQILIYTYTYSVAFDGI